MLRSLYSGISGMKNFQTKLDVIGNNIANVNTYGFKKSRVTFSDLVNQQLAGASAATQTQGGTNPKQIGLGTQVSSIDTIHTGGSTQTTSRTLDLALSGDGFFPVATIKDLNSVNIDQGTQMNNNLIMGSIDGAVNLNYTRAGNFYLDDRGYLVTAEGMFLVGEAGEKTIPSEAAIDKSQDALNAVKNFSTAFANIADSLAGISKQAKELMNAYNEYIDAQKTWEKSGSPAAGTSSHNAMQSAHGALGSILGQFNTAATEFTPLATGFQTNLTTLNGGITGFNVADPIGTIVKQIASIVAPITGDYPTAAPTIGQVVPDATQAQMNDLEVNLNNYLLDLNKVGKNVINFEDVATELQNAKFSDKLSGEAGLIQIPLTAQSFSIGPDGTVSFVNANGELNVAGQLRLATFANTGGLEKLGGNLFKESTNSGKIDKNNNGIQLNELSIAGTDGVASIIAGALEMSNVDLSEEFTEMIVAQRAFQSNTKIITTSDEILQEIMGLKR